MESRIWEEWNIILRDPPPNIVVGLDEGRITKWRASITGPAETPYYGGLFIVKIEFSNEYPAACPKIYFVTKVYHPNIDENTGEICLDAFKHAYHPSYRVSFLISCIIHLLAVPFPLDPLNGKAAYKYVHNNAEFEQIARNYTLEYAM